MGSYECVFISREGITSQQVEALNTHFVDLLTTNGAEVIKVEYWGLKNLAYKINKNRKGHYTLFHFNAPAAALNEMTRQMDLHEDVLRQMVLSLEEVSSEASVMMENRKEKPNVSFKVLKQVKSTKKPANRKPRPDLEAEGVA